MNQNDVPVEATGQAGVAERVAQRTLSRRGAAYADEVRRLLDAGLRVVIRCGTSTSPRVADIVAESGLSNEAFYRHFPSKAALITALLEDGAERLRSYLTHQLAKERTPRAQVRRWVAGVMSQADAEIAAATLAVLRHSASGAQAAGRHFAAAPLAQLLHEPLAALGSASPQLQAQLTAHAALGIVADHLWEGTQPTAAEVDRITAWCVAAAGSRAG